MLRANMHWVIQVNFSKGIGPKVGFSSNESVGFFNTGTGLTGLLKYWFCDCISITKVSTDIAA